MQLPGNAPPAPIAAALALRYHDDALALAAEGCNVVVVGRSGIDNGDVIRVPGRSDDEGARPVVGEHRRVVGYHASDEWRELLNIPVGGRILELELGWHGRILPDEPHWGEPRKTLGSALG